MPFKKAGGTTGRTAAATSPPEPGKFTCESCFRAKVRCNRNTPCDRCIRLHMQCYPHIPRPRRSAKDPALPPPQPPGGVIDPPLQQLDNKRQKQQHGGEPWPGGNAAWGAAPTWQGQQEGGDWVDCYATFLQRNQPLVPAAEEQVRPPQGPLGPEQQPLLPGGGRGGGRVASASVAGLYPQPPTGPVFSDGGATWQYGGPPPPPQKVEMIGAEWMAAKAEEGLGRAGLGPPPCLAEVVGGDVSRLFDDDDDDGGEEEERAAMMPWQAGGMVGGYCYQPKHGSYETKEGEGGDSGCCPWKGEEEEQRLQASVPKQPQWQQASVPRPVGGGLLDEIEVAMDECCRGLQALRLEGQLSVPSAVFVSNWVRMSFAMANKPFNSPLFVRILEAWVQEKEAAGGANEAQLSALIPSDEKGAEWLLELLQTPGSAGMWLALQGADREMVMCNAAMSSLYITTQELQTAAVQLGIFAAPLLAKLMCPDDVKGFFTTWMNCMRGGLGETSCRVEMLDRQGRRIPCLATIRWWSGSSHHQVALRLTPQPQQPQQQPWWLAGRPQYHPEAIEDGPVGGWPAAEVLGI